MMRPWRESLGKAPARWLLALNLVLAVSFPHTAKAHQLPKPVESKKKQSLHTVRKGETLSGIARLYGVGPRALVEINHLSRPDRLRVGQRLLIPEGRSGVADAVQREAAPVRSLKPPAHFVFAPPPLDGITPTFLWPLDGPISSYFGRRGNGWHAGIDIKVKVGTPILAVASGTVVFSGWERHYGHVIRIQHDHGFVSVYAHNLQNFQDVGDQVSAGQVIGTVGRTGRTTAHHLHFEIWNDGKVYDPIALFPTRSLVSVSEEDEEGHE